MEQALSNREVVELIASSGYATATDTNFSEFHNITHLLTEQCQWKNYVIADDLNMKSMLLAKVAHTAAPRFSKRYKVSRGAQYLFVCASNFTFLLYRYVYVH